MTAQEAQERAKEVAARLGLGPEETGTLVSGAAKLAALDVGGLDQASIEHHARAQRMPRTPLVAARQLLITLLREEEVVAGLPEAAREDYTSRLRGIGYVGSDFGPSTAEPDPAKAAERAAVAHKAAQIAELRKNPALLDPKHKDHAATVAQLAKLHEE